MTPELIFVMYAPGSKGKFITELCDTLLNTKTVPTLFNASGRVSWTNRINYNINNDWINGVFPENENHQKYIQEIFELSKKANVESLCIDTHYIETATAEYMLKNNFKVIYINADGDDIPEFANNFYYKNHIDGYEKFDDQWRRRKTDAYIRIIENNHKVSRLLNDQEYNYISQHFHLLLHKWPKECHDIFFNILKSKGPGSLNQSIKSDTIVHKNFLYLEYKNLGKQETIQQIANLVSAGVISKFAQLRFANYNANQQFGPYEEYITKFLAIE